MIPYYSTADLPAAPPLVPGSANLVLHYSADAITGVSDAGSLSSWLDISGNANDAGSASGVTGATNPTYYTGSGTPYVRFNGSTDILVSSTNSFTSVYTQHATIVVVYKTQSDFTNANRFFGNKVATNDYAKFMARSDYSNTDYPEAASTKSGVADNVAMAGSSVGSGVLVKAIGVWNGTNVKYYQGGTLQNTTAFNSTIQGATSNTKPWCIGGLVENGSKNFMSAVDIYKIMVYNTDADSTLLSDIASYISGY